MFAGNDKAIIYYLPGLHRWTDTFGGRPAQFQVQDYNCSVKDGAVTIAKYTGKGGNIVIPDKIEGLPVTTIGDNAFSGNAQLTGVKIPNSVTYIGFFAFQDCTKLSSVNIPASVTSIRWAPFAGCTSLTSIPVDEANTAYSSKEGVLFDKDQTYLLNYPAGKAGAYEIPSTVGQLGCSSFMGCSKLTEVTMPDYPNILPNGSVFYGCTSLSKVTLPSRLTRIGSWEFTDCTSLESITIPASVTTTGRGVFRRCPNLTAVYFMGNAPKPDDGSMFAGSTKATVYYLPETKGWGKEFLGRPTAVWDPEKDAKPSLPQTGGVTTEPHTEGPFSYTVKDGAVTIVKYTGPGGEVKIPEKINGLPVTEIGQKAFFACIKMTRVALPAGLIRLGDYAFDNCAGLTHVEIPSTVTEISNFAFNRCSGLTRITIPTSVTRIGDFAFANCTSLPTITIPDSVTSIGIQAFKACTSLVDVSIPNSVTSIGGNAFLDCIKLPSVMIPASVTTIGRPGPFSGCSALVKITVDEANPAYCSVDGVLFDKKNAILFQCQQGKAGTYKIPADFTRIGPGAFANCTKLTGITIPDNIIEIGDNAFAGCTGLTSIHIPASVSSIVGVPFSGCSALTAITVDAANPFFSSADGVLFNKQKTVLIRCPGTKAGHYEIPGGVTKISPSAFEDCPNLTGITIPETVTEIGDGAFTRCISLTTMTIPARASQINPGAFLGCDKLVSIKVDATNPAYASEDGVLFNKDKTKLVRCPQGRTGTYVVPAGVTSIENLAFVGCANLTDITIPQSVGNIGDKAFIDCSRLNRVEIGKGLRSIGHRAFCSCWGLTWVVFCGDAPEGDTTAFCHSGKAAIYHLPETKGWGKEFAGRPTALWDPTLRFCYATDKDGATLIGYIGTGGDVTIPDKIGGLPVTSIAESAFQNCTTLTSLTVPEGVKSIMGRTFDGCSGLTKVTLPASVTSMGTYPEGQWNPFVNCPRLASITVAAANPAFQSNADGILFNKDLTTLLAYPGGRAGSYTIPDSVTNVGLAAFEGCAELTDVKIHSGVTALGLYAGGRAAANPFSNCPKLTSIAVDETNAIFSSTEDGVVFNKDRSALVCYPAGKGGAYTVPDGVTRIGESAFASCPGLSSVTMPASITIIGYVAFMNSGDLKEVHFKGNAPTNVAWNSLQGADKATIHYLPTAKGWGKEFCGRPTAVWEEKAKAEN